MQEGRAESATQGGVRKTAWRQHEEVAQGGTRRPLWVGGARRRKEHVVGMVLGDEEDGDHTRMAMARVARERERRGFEGAFSLWVSRYGAECMWGQWRVARGILRDRASRSQLRSLI
jgi:hypothetical protein